MSLPIVAIVGAPNVGKSTLFNRLVRARRSIVTDERGVTRDRVYGEVRDAPRAFRVVDTGGLLAGPEEPFERHIESQAETALEESDLVLFVVDARAGATAADHEIASRLRRRAGPVLVVANKIDAPALEALAAEFHTLGLGEPVPVSAEHGLGIDLLLESVARRLATLPESSEEPEPIPPIRIAIVGRPNVGKSSLVNALLGEERVMVSEVPGTTRDVVDTRIEHRGRGYLLLDTAGIRRMGRVHLAAETVAVTMARKAIQRADVVVLVVDAVQGLTAQDAHIAGYAHDAHRPLVAVVNKWDCVARKEEEAKAWGERLRDGLAFAKNPPMVLASAKTGLRVDRMLQHAAELHAAAGRRIPTAELNRWLREVAHGERAAPARGRSVNLLYATQTGIHPPRFVVFCSQPERVHFSLRRFLDNRLRERFAFGSIPVRLQFRPRPDRGRR